MNDSRTSLVVFCVVVISMAISIGGCENDGIPVSIELQCSAPTFNPPAGAYQGRQSVEINCSTKDATIRYTTDGSVPVETSSRYTIPIQVSGNATIKARAWKENYNRSGVASASYIIILDVVSTPTFHPPPGVYVGVQNVEITCATEGATIRYTTDGSEPTEISPDYTEPIEILDDTTIKAMAWKGNMEPSETAVGSYTIEPIVQVATPTFNPRPGIYEDPQTVAIACSTEGATIRYTTNRSVPIETSSLYSEPIQVVDDGTVRARAWKENMEPSRISTGWYTIRLGVTEPELLLPGPGGKPGVFHRTVLWLDRPDFAAGVVSSEIIGSYGLESEVAGDFTLEEDACVMKVTWWGTYWNGNEWPPIGAGFNIRFYHGAGCLPEATAFSEHLLPGDDCFEALAEGGDMFSQFVYEYCLELCLPAGLWWFSVQMAEHDWAFPPQWGRQGADRVQNCSGCIRSAYFGCPEWQPLDSIVDTGCDASQVIEDVCIPVAPGNAGWQAVERLFR